MSETRIIVDHLRLEYKGPLKVKELFKLIGAWHKEKGLQKKEDKNFEQDLPSGKSIEYEISYWKKISYYTRYIIKLRALFSELKRVQLVHNDKRITTDEGKVLMYFDGIIEHDHEHRWDDRPLFIFIRTLYDKFIYKAYTERFEQRLTQDVHDLYHTIESFLNTYRYWRIVSKVPHFSH